MFLLLVLIGCAGPAPASPPTTPPDMAAPPPRPTEPTRTEDARISLAALSPDVPATPGPFGINESGVFTCQQAYATSPPADAHNCEADGFAVTATLVHQWAPDLTLPASFLDSDVSVSRVTDCGNRLRPVRRPDTALLNRISPVLTATHLQNEAPGSFTGSCRDPRITLIVPRDTRHQLVASTHRFVLPSTHGSIRVEVDGQPIADWPIGLGRSINPCDSEPSAALISVDLEIVCAGYFAVVSGVSWSDRGPCGERVPRGLIGAGPGVSCDPDENHSGHSIREAKRLRVRLDSGQSQLLEAPAITFETTP